MANILLFEDEKLLRENTAELLELSGYSCTPMVHGKECVKVVLETNPDLILCDIMLPFLTGYEIKEELNKHIETANVPFIFLSARIEDADKKRGLELGAADYIVKPYRIDALINSIEKSLSENRTTQ